MVAIIWLNLLCLGMSVVAAKHESGGGGGGSPGANASPSSSSTSTTTSKAPSTTPVAAAPVVTTPDPPAAAPTPTPTPVPAPVTTPQSPDSTPLPVAAQAQAGNRGESPNASSSTPSTTFPTTVPSPLPSNAFQFSQPNNLTTCSSADFVWSFEDTSIIPVTIMVTNERGAAMSQSANTTLISRVLSTTVSATACAITWPIVNVPPGMYSLVGFNTSSTDPNLFALTTFWVNAGKDTSCVTTDNSATPTDTSNDGSATDPSESTTSSPRSLSTGAMVGTIAGVIVGVCGIVAAFVIPRYRKRKPPPDSSPRPGGPYILF